MAKAEGNAETNIWNLLKQLSQNGGAIVREQDISPEDLEAAKAEGRYWGDFVYEPIKELSDETEKRS